MNSIIDKMTSGQVDLDNYDDLLLHLVQEFLEFRFALPNIGEKLCYS